MKIFSRIFPRLSCVSIAALLVLGACQTPPPPPADPHAQRDHVLREQGFVQTDDGWELQLFEKLLFALDSDTLTSEQHDHILQMGRSLAAVGVQTLRVEGHTDSQGSASYNERLSLRRAQTVTDVLVEAGIPRESIEVHGYGSSHPLNTGTDKSARAENRRVAIVVPSQ